VGGGGGCRELRVRGGGRGRRRGGGGGLVCKLLGITYSSFFMYDTQLIFPLSLQRYYYQVTSPSTEAGTHLLITP